MKKARFTETQILRILKEVEGVGMRRMCAAKTVCQRPAITTGNLNMVAWGPLISNE